MLGYRAASDANSELTRKKRIEAICHSLLGRAEPRLDNVTSLIHRRHGPRAIRRDKGG